MIDETEEQNSTGLNLRKLQGVAARRHWYFLIPLFVGWALVWGVGWILPSTYKSSTTILVEQPTMPKEYVVPNVNDNLQDRLQSITQQILSRTRLIHIIDQLNLYSQERGKVTPDDLVERMRKDIQIELVHSPGSEQLTSFNVTYSARDPRTAQRVTSELTNLFISENLEVRQQESEDTTKFLATQLEEARKNLSEQEAKIRGFKGEHVSDLPGQLQSNLTILGGLQTQLQAEEDNLSRAKQQNAYFQSLIGQYSSQQKSPKAAEASNSELTALDQELETLKARLADLRSHYTEKHPDVRKMKDQISQTEKRRREMLADSGSHSSSAANPGGGDARDSAPLAELRSQLQANKVEISTRERSIAELKGKIGDYQGRLGQEPVREQQLADLSRGYDQSKANYDDLLKKKNASEMATSLELRQQGEHFRILDPPSLPVRPDSPNHLKLSGFGLLAGLVLGSALAIGSEVVDDRVYSEEALKELVPVGVISEIPDIATPEEALKKQHAARNSWVAASAVAVLIAAGTALSYWRG